MKKMWRATMSLSIKVAKAFLCSHVVASTVILALVQQGFCDSGVWSTEATDLSFSIGTPQKPGTRDIVITSPDRTKRIVVGDNELRVEVDGDRIIQAFKEAIGVDTLAELCWAPDSRAFFLTQSDGGSVGTYDVYVYTLRASKVLRADVSSDVRRDFMKRYNCDVWGYEEGNELPNVAGITWLKGSAELLLLAEVPPHSSCPEMGKFMGYSVSVPSGKILARYSAKEVKTRWGKSLGIRHGNDENYDTTKDRLAPWPK